MYRYPSPPPGYVPQEPAQHNTPPPTSSEYYHPGYVRSYSSRTSEPKAHARRASTAVPQQHYSHASARGPMHPMAGAYITPRATPEYVPIFEDSKISRPRRSHDHSARSTSIHHDPNLDQPASMASLEPLKTEALENSELWTMTKPSVDVKLITRPEDALEAANELCIRRFKFADYRDSVDNTFESLCLARSRIVNIRHDFPKQKDSRILHKHALADVYSELGDFEKAESALHSTLPSIITGNAPPSILSQRDFDTLVRYLAFCAWTGRQTYRAKRIGKFLPWTAIGQTETALFKVNTLAYLARISNDEGSYEEAEQYLWVAKHISANVQFHAEYLAQCAVGAIYGDNDALGQESFVKSLIVTTLKYNNWHRNTLDTLFYWGQSLRSRGRDAPASKLLQICSQGFAYTFGAHHPLTKRALKQLQKCKDVHSILQMTYRSMNKNLSTKRKSSLAFESCSILTLVDLLKPAFDLDYSMMLEFVEELSANQPDLSLLRVQRLIAQCILELGGSVMALDALGPPEKLRPGGETKILDDEAFTAIVALDHAKYTREGRLVASDAVFHARKAAFFALESFREEQSDQRKAMHRQLAEHGLIHFLREHLFEDPPLLLEVDREPIGSGSYSVVDVVKVGRTLYARKSIHMPRRGQIPRMELIRKELAIMRILDHPHNIRVFLTYEETTRFCILMHPLAECDLETFLMKRTCSTGEDRYRMWKWISCLANTLAFIHSQDVRHKDIKPRNILVKGEKIYFADFGSSHMFAEEGASTTEGPAFGHTRAYCAPEVIQNSSRNRLTDVFSLGCVFAEMFIWTRNVPLAQFWDDIRPARQTSDLQYSASTALLRIWFDKHRQSEDEVEDFYMEILRHMVRVKPKARWSALAISRGVAEYFSQIPACFCPKCPVDTWVPETREMPSISVPTRRPDTGSPPPDHDSLVDEDST